MAFEVTLRPDVDEAALIALYVYAHMKRDKELRARLDATPQPETDLFESMPADPTAPFRFLEQLSYPDRTHASLVETLRWLHLEPVALVARYVEPGEPKAMQHGNIRGV